MRPFLFQKYNLLGSKCMGLYTVKVTPRLSELWVELKNG